MNKVFLIGNLTKDPDLSNTTSGLSVCKFTLAVSRRYVGNDGSREADFLPIVVWRNQAENCAKWLKKGSKAAVIGSIQTRSYDAQDGTKRYVTEIIADEIQFLNSRFDGDDAQDLPEVAAKKGIESQKPIDGDLPF